MDITGRIHKVFPAQEYKNNFTKREFVLIDDSNEQFPQYILFQLIKDRCELIDKYNEGDTIKVFFNLNGREWVNPEGKIIYFNSITAWKIEGNEDGQKSVRKQSNVIPEEVQTPF